MIKIGDVVLDNHIIVGPMAGISNYSFRSIIKLFNPALIYSEMISDKAICFENKKTIKMTEVEENEKPITLQLFGKDVDTLVKAAQFLDNNTNCDIIDLNMGCPVPKVCKSNGGSSLMLDVEYSSQIVKAICDNVKKPVTVKIRAGWDSNHINGVDFACQMAKTGIKALAIHPRTRAQYYSGHSDWNMIKQIKEKITSIPIIGNGDIFSLQDYLNMKQLTHCDFFMVSRGSLGNPWLIKQLVDYDKYSIITENPTMIEKLNQCILHCQKLIELKGEKTGIKEMRGHACWYINSMPHANKVKAQINHMENYQQFEQIIESYRTMIENDDFSQLDDIN